MKTELDALGTAQNGPVSAKHENETRRPLYRRKWVREHKTYRLDPTPSALLKTSMGVQNMKTGPDVLGTVENDFGSIKHANGKRCPRYRP
jgi:hypothetical protein